MSRKRKLDKYFTSLSDDRLVVNHIYIYTDGIEVKKEDRYVYENRRAKAKYKSRKSYSSSSARTSSEAEVFVGFGDLYTI